jgi:hypothetical protein
MQHVTISKLGVVPDSVSTGHCQTTEIKQPRQLGSGAQLLTLAIAEWV